MTPMRSFLSSEPVTPNHSEQGDAVDAREPGRFNDVAARPLEETDHIGALESRQHFVFGLRHRQLLQPTQQALYDSQRFTVFERRWRLQYDELLEKVSQLAHVARPGVLPQARVEL